MIKKEKMLMPPTKADVRETAALLKDFLVVEYSKPENIPEFKTLHALYSWRKKIIDKALN